MGRFRHRGADHQPTPAPQPGASHSGDDELLLAYELMPNGSLDVHVYNKSSEQRALAYVAGPARRRAAVPTRECRALCRAPGHQAQQCHARHVLQRQAGRLRARLVHDRRRSHTTGVAGTFGNMDPECMLAGRASVGSDVYSFGVLLLEVACGQRPAVRVGDNDDDDFAYGGGSDAADAQMGGEFDAREVACMMLVELWCAHPDRSLIRLAINVCCGSRRRRRACLRRSRWPLTVRRPAVLALHHCPSSAEATAGGDGGTM
ncbi:hypothetical protein EJB05_00442, partial [Eragrostis curvula]